MPTVRHIIVCEGESERAYLQRLQKVGCRRARIVAMTMA